MASVGIRDLRGWCVVSCWYDVLLPVRAAVMRRGSVGEVLTGRLVVISVTGVLLAACTGGAGGDGDAADPTGSGRPRTSSSSGVSTPAATTSATPTTTPGPVGRSVFDATAAMSTVRTLSRGGAREATTLAYLRAAAGCSDGSPGWATSRGGRLSGSRPGSPGGSSVGSGRTYNVVAVPPGFDPARPHVVVGAHLDTVPQSPGAEDNASGVAVVLELARRGRPVRRDCRSCWSRSARRSRAGLATTSTTSVAGLRRRLDRRRTSALRAMVSLDRVGRPAGCRSAPAGCRRRRCAERCWPPPTGRRPGARVRQPDERPLAVREGGGDRRPGRWQRLAGLPLGAGPAAVVSTHQLERVGRVLTEWLRRAHASGGRRRWCRATGPAGPPTSARIASPRGPRARRGAKSGPMTTAPAAPVRAGAAERQCQHAPSCVCRHEVHVEDEVAQRVDDQPSRGDRLHALHPVRVAADDEVGARPGPGRRATNRWSRTVSWVYCVPQCGSTMHHVDPAGEVAHDAGHPGQVAADRAGRCAAASAAAARPGVAGPAAGVSPIASKATMPNACRSRSTTTGRAALSQVGPGADGHEAAGPAPGRRSRPAPRAVVAGVVVGQRQHVEAGQPQPLPHRGSRAERVAALARRPGRRQRALQVADGQVRGCEPPRHRPQGSGRVVDGSQPVADPTAQHHVTGDQDGGDRARIRGRGVGRRSRRRTGRGRRTTVGRSRGRCVGGRGAVPPGDVHAARTTAASAAVTALAGPARRTPIDVATWRRSPDVPGTSGRLPVVLLVPTRVPTPRARGSPYNGLLSGTGRPDEPEETTGGRQRDDVGRHGRAGDRPARARPGPRRDPPARRRLQGGRRLVGLLHRRRDRLRRGLRLGRRLGLRHRVLRRLHRREEPVGRQPLRLRRSS